VPEVNKEAFEKIWEGFPFIKIGTVRGNAFEWKNIFNIPLITLKKAFMEGHL
jgi:hypothetical protein